MSGLLRSMNQSQRKEKVKSRRNLYIQKIVAFLLIVQSKAIQRCYIVNTESGHEGSDYRESLGGSPYYVDDPDATCALLSGSYWS